MKNYEYTDGFGDKMVVQSYANAQHVTVTIESPDGTDHNVLVSHDKASDIALAILEMSGHTAPEVPEEVFEYTTYYFTDTRNGRQQEVNGVARIEFERHFVLFYDENEILILGERQEYITDLRQEIAA